MWKAAAREVAEAGQRAAQAAAEAMELPLESGSSHKLDLESRAVAEAIAPSLDQAGVACPASPARLA